MAIACAVLGAGFVTNHYWGRVPIRYGSELYAKWKAIRTDPEFVKIRLALEKIPRDAVVSADYALVPQLSHRHKIYMFPNPFLPDNWGIHQENPHDPQTVEYIAVRSVTNPKYAELLDGLVRDNRFVQIASAKDFALYRHVVLSALATCGDWNGDTAIMDEDVQWIAAAIMAHRECPLRVCDADGDGKASYADVLRFGKRLRDPHAPLSCPP
jgi:hypothetical protein